jgi:hypothetical protein
MDAFDINARLIRLHGHDTVYEQPVWRLMWSGNLMIKRHATYEDYTTAGIYLGTKTGIREHKKYWHLPDCWVLERIQHVQTKGVHSEINMPYSYELVYAFLDRNNKLLPLAWAPIEFLLKVWAEAERTHLATYPEVVAKKEANDVKIARDILEEEDEKWKPTFESSVHVKAEPEVKGVTE